MKLKGKKVFVTGAAGFIGSHLIERLVKEDCEVKALVHYNSLNSYGNLENIPKETLKSIEIIKGDVQDPFMIRKAVKDCDVIFHLAALIAIPYSYSAPLSYVKTNTEGTLNIMQASLDEGVKKIVHTSTSECYGTARYVPIDENHPLQGQSPYSASKIAADKIAESYYLSFDLPVATIRPFNTYGPRQSSRALIPTIITQALTKKTVTLGSLHPRRDFTFVKDTVNGFFKIAENDKSIGQTINIGSNKDISVGEIAEKISNLVGKDVKINQESLRKRPEKSEVDRLMADYNKAKKIIGWEPKYSLNDGLKETIKWISENMDKYKIEEYNV